MSKLECWSTLNPGNRKASAEIALRMAVFFLDRNDTIGAEMVGNAFDAAVDALEAQQESVGSQWVRRPTDTPDYEVAIAQMMVDRERACIILGKRHTWVVAPVNDDAQYAVLCVEKQTFQLTPGPEYDVSIRETISDIIMVSKTPEAKRVVKRAKVARKKKAPKASAAPVAETEAEPKVAVTLTKKQSK